MPGSLNSVQRHVPELTTGQQSRNFVGGTQFSVRLGMGTHNSLAKTRANQFGQPTIAVPNSCLVSAFQTYIVTFQKFPRVHRAVMQLPRVSIQEQECKSESRFEISACSALVENRDSLFHECTWILTLGSCIHSEHTSTPVLFCMYSHETSRSQHSTVV